MKRLSHCGCLICSGAGLSDKQVPMPTTAHGIPFWTSVASHPAFKSKDLVHCRPPSTLLMTKPYCFILDNNAVIFDLFNEPFPDANAYDTDNAWRCWRDGGRCPGTAYAMCECVNVCVCMYTCICACVRMRVHVRARARVRLCACMCTCKYLRVYMPAYANLLALHIIFMQMGNRVGRGGHASDVECCARCWRQQVCLYLHALCFEACLYMHALCYETCLYLHALCFESRVCICTHCALNRVFVYVRIVL